MRKKEEIKKQIDQLNGMLADGVLKLQSGEETIVFRSVKEVKEILGGLENELEVLEKGKRSTRQKVFRPKQGKGL